MENQPPQPTQAIESNIAGATKKGKATTGLVLGIIGLIAWFIPIIGLPVTIVGLVFSIKGLKSLKRGMAITAIVLCSIGLLASVVNLSIGAYLGATGQNPLVNKILNNKQQNNMNISSSFKFPEANYKDFASGSNSDNLDPKKATPNITEFGSPHLVIEKDADGYSETSLPLLGINLNIPFGWGSKGGFDTMERVGFFPITSKDNLKEVYLNGSSIDLGVKVLNTSSLGVTDFNGVMEEVKKIAEDSNQSVTVEADGQNHSFLFKNETINNPELTATSSNYAIYIQSPIPGSTAWVNISIRAPKDQFQKYLGLLGLVSKDIKIDWQGLDSYMKEAN